MEEKIAVLVDDDPATRKVVKMFLEFAGFKVHPTASGQDAKPLILKHQPHLLVTDYNMPGMNGAQLVTQVRESGNHHTHVLGISGMAGGLKDPGSMMAFVDWHNKTYPQAPPMHFLEKPIALKDFKAKLEEMDLGKETAQWKGRINEMKPFPSNRSASGKTSQTGRQTSESRPYPLKRFRRE